MQLAFTQKQEAFRQEIRGFLKQELPDDWEGLEEATSTRAKAWSSPDAWPRPWLTRVG